MMIVGDRDMMVGDGMQNHEACALEAIICHHIILLLLVYSYSYINFLPLSHCSDRKMQSYVTCFMANGT